jgi:hypothetical protein
VGQVRSTGAQSLEHKQVDVSFETAGVGVHAGVVEWVALGRNSIVSAVLREDVEVRSVLVVKSNVRSLETGGL